MLVVGGSGCGSGKVSQSKLWGLESILKHICRGNLSRLPLEKVSHFYLNMDLLRLTCNTYIASMSMAGELSNFRRQTR